MPQEADFEFGRKAVAEGLISQERIEEAVELLYGLEKVSSAKRLWDVVTERGWMRPDDAERLRAAVEGPEEEESSAATAEEGDFVLAVIRRSEEPEIIPLTHRPMTLGRTKECDIRLEAEGVEMRHARITFTDTGPRIWDVGSETGVVVNGVRRRHADLHADDLVQIGQAMLVVCYDLKGAAIQYEPVSASRIIGPPTGKFLVEEGERDGEIFYLGDRAMTFGRFRLATVRLSDARVALLHAHVAAGPKGVVVTDLKSSFGTLINGRPAAQATLASGDLVEIGEAKLRFVHLGAPPEAAPARPGVARAAGVPPKPEPESRQESSLLIPTDVEVEAKEAPPAATPGEGGKPGETHTDVASQRERDTYTLGEVVLAAIEGPIEGQYLTIRRRNILIGRSDAADIVIPDISVSREHARVTLSPEGVLEIEDLGSRNGVRINGRKVTRAVLRIGDTIRLGTTAMIVDRKKAR